MSLQGYLSIVLHAHLPFIRHPEYPDFLEEDWLFEAMTETYIPLLRMMQRLNDDHIRFRLTMSLTPPLCEMLADPLLQERYVSHIDRLSELAELQRREKMGTPFQDAATAQADELLETKRLFEQVWNRQLLPVFRKFQDQGDLEIITCGATHGFLPLMATDEARRAQISIAVANYKKHFGRAPRGIWLPECAFVPGIDALLAENGISFFRYSQRLPAWSPKSMLRPDDITSPPVKPSTGPKREWIKQSSKNSSLLSSSSPIRR